MKANAINRVEAAIRQNVARCKILPKVEPQGPLTGLAVFLIFDGFGEIPMKVNDKAPDFTLQDENGKEIALKGLRG